jgi:phosphate transport system permease protein
MIWLTGGALAVCLLMIVGLILLVLWQGLFTFWPSRVVRLDTWTGGVYMGEITRQEVYRPAPSDIESLPAEARQDARAALEETGGEARRSLIRTGNYRLTQNHFQWISELEVRRESRPDWAMVVERLEWGRFYGFPLALLEITPIPDGATPGDAIPRLVEDLGGQEAGQIRLLAQGSGVGEPELLPLDQAENAGRILGVVRVIDDPKAAWTGFREHHRLVRSRWNQRRALEEHDSGAVNLREEKARLAMRSAEIRLEEAEAAAGGEPEAVRSARRELDRARARYEETRSWANAEFTRIREEINAINRENGRYQLLMETAGEGSMPARRQLLRLDEIVRAYPANSIGAAGRFRVYLSRWWEFLADEPREANSEGGVFPAIFGTVAMTLIMSVAVVPFGVLAALYLREYAKAGAMVSTVRIAVNNLAGVPSIVFGVFGLGFFCYLVGASLDELLFSARLPNPTYGKGGLLWASLTLALLTLPVVIVATEETLAAVPNSMREGSYACGASKWQTIRRIVLPRALPGITTGMILAIARGAGEVAPLMLVGAVKLAPELPVDTLVPFIHPERSFMHLGFHIYDVGFQSQNSEAAKPMVYTTTLLLIAIIAVLNLAAIWLRTRLRRRFVASQF